MKNGLKGTVVLAVAMAAMFSLQACESQKSSQTPKHVLLIGVESLSLEMMDQLIEAGELPNLARLQREGASGTVQAPDPLQSAMLWATALTGKSAAKHRYTAQLVEMPGTGDVTMGPSSMRVAKNIFQAASAEGISVAQVGFPGTWPAEILNGQSVAYGATPSRWTLAAEHTLNIDRGQMATVPAELFKEIEPFLREPDEIKREDASRFFTLNENEFERMYDWPLGSIYEHQNPLRDFAVTFQRDMSMLATADYIRQTYRPTLMGIHLELLESVQPSYWAFARPEHYDIPTSVTRRFGHTVESAYKWLDEQVGVMLANLPAASTVCIVGNRGFGDGSLPGSTADAPAQPTPLVKNETAIILWGQGIARGVDLGTVQLADIGPTILTMLDSPIGADMDGQVLDEAFTPAFLQIHPERVVESLDATWDHTTRYPARGDSSTASSLAP